MSCTICTKSFGFFNKEYGCPVCKYSFCSGCLKHKLVREGKKLNVCLRCSKLGTGPSKPEIQPESSKAAKVELVASSNRVEHAVPKPEAAGEPVLTEPGGDDLIRSKLDALKTTDSEELIPGTDGSAPCDNTDIEKRLAALKGVEYKDYKNAAQRFMAVDNRTKEQKVQDLLGQFVEETKLDDVIESRRTNQDEEIAKRLNALKEPLPGGEGKGAPARSVLPDIDSDEGLTDEELARKLAQRYVEEGKMEAKLHPRVSDSDDESLNQPPKGDEEDPLPWCTICNEDAVLRCTGCDNDLYCKACYKEFHYDEDPQEHRTVPFNGKGSKKR